MNRKTFLILIGLVGLGALTFYVLQKNSRSSAGAAAGQNFAVADTAGIDKIILTKRSGSSHTLERQPTGGWRMNGTEDVAPAMIQQLLMTMHDLRVKRPTTRAEHDVVIKAMATDNIKVEVSGSEAAEKTYFLGSSTDEGLGNYGLLEGSDEPVVVYLPSFQGFVSPRYEVTGPAWRDKQLYRSTPQTLEDVTVEYPDMPSENVHLTIKPGPKGPDFRLEGVAHPDSSRLIPFIAGLSGVFIEDFVTDSRLADSIAKAKPMAKFKLKDLNPKHSHEFWLYIPNTPGYDITQQDRLYGYIADQKTAVTIQPQNYLQLLARKSAFVKEGM